KRVNNFESDFAEDESDFAQLFDVLGNSYENRNLGAVIVAGDGIYNRGDYPVYPAGELNVPVYAVALGDTTVYKDAGIKSVKHNKIVFTGNAFQTEVNVQATRMQGAQLKVSVYDGNKVVESKQINISRPN